MKKIAFLISVCFSWLANAQQDIQITQNMFNKFAVNPAYAGATSNLNASVLHRSQWVGFEGAPTSQIFNLEVPVYALAGGVGLNVVNDAIGNGFRYRQVGATYAFRGKLGDETFLGLGFNAGFFNIDFNYDTWLASDGGDGSNDPHIPDVDASAIVPDFGVGAYLQYKNFNFGVSSTHIVEFDAELDGGKDAVYGSNRHYYFIGEANFEMNRLWSIAPSVFIKTDEVKPQFDFATNFIYKDLFTVGAAYRTFDAVAIMASYKYDNKILVGYSYDITISELKSYQSGSHEVFVRYSLPIKVPAKARTRYRNNRFL